MIWLQQISYSILSYPILFIFSIDTLILHDTESHNMIWYMIDRIWSNMALVVVISLDFRLSKLLTRRYSNLLQCFILKFDAFFLLHKFAIIYILHWFHTLMPISSPSFFSLLFFYSFLYWRKLRHIVVEDDQGIWIHRFLRIDGWCQRIGRYARTSFLFNLDWWYLRYRDYYYI